VGREDGGAHLVEDVVERGAAGCLVGPEAVEDAVTVEDEQAVLVGVAAVEGELGELFGGEHAVVVEHLPEVAVAWRDAGGEVAEQIGGRSGSRQYLSR
jgi:hypothetical protein